MTCPYLDCTRKRLGAAVDRCPQCDRRVRSCEACSQYNRPFANHCRNCGASLAPPSGDWIGFRGGPQRIAVNRQPGFSHFRKVAPKPIASLSLNSACRGLLFVEDHLLAISEGGLVKLRDSAGDGLTGEGTFDGPLCGEPAVGRGSLYLGTKRGVTAFTLGDITGKQKTLEARWHMELPGVPTGSLLPWGDHLYLRIAGENRTETVVRIADAAKMPSSELDILAKAQRFTDLAGQPYPTDRIYWLAEKSGEILQYEVRYPDRSEPPREFRIVQNAPLPLHEHRPIAVIGKRVFAVLQDSDTLCKLDGGQASFSRRFRDDVRDYALQSPGKGVAVHGGGLFSLYDRQDEKHAYLRNVTCSPVLVDDFAIFFGLPSGSVRYHRLDNLAVYEDLQLTQQAGARITALASAGDRLAAGNAQGLVCLWRLES